MPSLFVYAVPDRSSETLNEVNLIGVFLLVFSMSSGLFVPCVVISPYLDTAKDISLYLERVSLLPRST